MKLFVFRITEIIKMGKFPDFHKALLHSFNEWLEVKIQTISSFCCGWKPKACFKWYVVSCLTGNWGYWEAIVFSAGKGRLQTDIEPWYYNKPWQDDLLWHHWCSAQWAHWASWSCFPAVNNIRTCGNCLTTSVTQKTWFSEDVINGTPLPHIANNMSEE